MNKIIGFDLDGTLYDALNENLGLDNNVLVRLGYPPVSRRKYREIFQTKDWGKLYEDCGIKKEHIILSLEIAAEEHNHMGIPRLIPGAEYTLTLLETALGRENMYFITNEPLHRVKKRFERDGLTRFLSNVRTPNSYKAGELYKLALEQKDASLTYVGDLVSDGEACLEARRNGAHNLFFYAIIHEYAMNTPEALHSFVEQNKDFARIMNDLKDISKVWKDQNSLS